MKKNYWIILTAIIWVLYIIDTSFYDIPDMNIIRNLALIIPGIGIAFASIDYFDKRKKSK